LGRLLNKEGKPEFVPDNQVPAKLAEGYSPDPNSSYRMRDSVGTRVTVKGSHLLGKLDERWTLESQEGTKARQKSEADAEQYGGAEGVVTGVLEAGARGLTGPLYDIAARAIGDEKGVAARRENLGLVGSAIEVGTGLGAAVATGGTSLGARALAATPAGLVTRVGTNTAAKYGPVAGLVAEGSLWGVGGAGSELALSQDPLTLEKVASTVGVHTALSVGAGLAVHGVATVIGKAWNKGVSRAKKVVDQAGQKALATEDLGEELAPIVASRDIKSLKAVKQGEQAKVAAERILANKEAAGSVAAYREQAQKVRPWEALEGFEAGELNGIRKNAFEADKHLDRQLRDIKGLEENPARALQDVRINNQVWDDMLARDGDIRERLLKADMDQIEANYAKVQAENGAIDLADPLVDRSRSLREQAEKLSGRADIPVVLDPNATAPGLSKKALENVERANFPADVARYLPEARQLEAWALGKPELALAAKNLQKANNRLEFLLGDAKALAAKPGPAIKVISRAEQAIGEIASQADGLRPAYAGENASRFQQLSARLDQLPALRAAGAELEAKLVALTKEPTSAYLDKIKLAEELVKEPVVKGLIRKSVEGSIAGAGGVAGGALAGWVGAPVGYGAGRILGEKVGELVWGRSARAVTENQSRFSTALGKLGKAAKKASVIAPSKVLSALRFGDEQPKPEHEPSQGKLTEAYRSREREIRAAVAPTPMGTLAVKPEVRQRIYENLSGVRAASPVLADRIEGKTVAKLEFLANKLPRRPDDTLLGLVQGSPWRPSDFEIAAFSRLARAVEDPASVIESFASGSLTPEEAEAFRSVYPELYQQTILDLVTRLGKGEKLTASQKLSMFILTGQPMDPAHQPNVIRRLQANYQFEPGTEGGMAAPRATPQGGSIKNSAETEATPAQDRASGNS
jgi:hypothetical protein